MSLYEQLMAMGDGVPCWGDTELCDPPDKGDRFVAFYLGVSDFERVNFEVTEVEQLGFEWEGSLKEIEVEED